MSEAGSGPTNLGIPGIDDVVEIGRSASHTTYRVRDVATGRMVVVKLLNAGRDWPGLEERFEQEQAALTQLVGHPNIVAVHGHGWTETGMPYVVSGEEPGGSIGDRLRGPTPMTGPDIIALGVRLAGALESAHRAGVVHGDLGPDDILLSERGEPLLADFGLVTLIRPNAAGVTDPQALAHVAPELLDGAPASPASDIYALASALYTLLSGEPAFVRRTDTSVVPVIKRIASDPLPDLKARNVPASVSDAVSKAMSKLPDDRYKSAQDFGRALQQSQVALGLPMTDMTLLGSPTTRATAAQSTAAGAAAGGVAAGALAAAAAAGGPGGPGGPPGGPGGPGGPPGATPSKSRMPLFIGIGVAAVLIIAAIIFFATRDGDSEDVVTSTESTSSSRPPPTDPEPPPVTDPPVDIIDLVSDGGQITVTVPTTWVATNTTSAPGDPPEVQASTDLTEFLEGGTYLSPGVDAAVFGPGVFDPANLDTAVDAILNREQPGGLLPLSTVCTRGIREDFVTLSGGLTARRELLTGCNGGGDVLVLAATNAANEFVMGAEIHFGVPPDDEGAQLALDTVDVLNFP